MLLAIISKVKTQQVAKSRGHHCGDIELVACLANAAGPAPLVLELRITHDRFGRSSDATLHGNLHYPNDIDRSLNETGADKIRNIALTIITTPLMLSPLCLLLLVRLGGYMVNLCAFCSGSSGN